MDKEDENPKENHPPKDIKQNEEKSKDENQNNQKQKDEEKEKEHYKKSRKQKHYQKYYQNIAKERHKPQQHTWGSVPKVEKC